jgi:hypothetical protein
MIGQAIDVRRQLRVLGEIHIVALRRDEGVAEQDIGGRELSPSQEGAVVGRGRELLVQKAEVCGVILRQVSVVDAAGDGAGDGFDEEGLRGVLDFCRIAYSILAMFSLHIPQALTTPTVHEQLHHKQ